MRSFNRRQFLRAAIGTAACVSAGASLLRGYDLSAPLGFQAHGLRVLLSADFPGTLKKVKALGYDQVELVSFRGYSGNTSRDGFAALAPMDPSTIREIVADSGLAAPSCHFKFTEFQDDVIDRTIDWAHGAGVKYMVVVDLPAINTPDDCKATFDSMNRFADRVFNSGLQLGHHTQPDDWKTIDGKLVMDQFLESTDLRRCQMELDLESTMTMGVDGADYLQKHPDRFFALHLRDAKTPATMGKYLNSLPLGEGDIDWKKMLQAASSAHVSRYFVEMEIAAPGDPMDALRISADYIRNLVV